MFQWSTFLLQKIKIFLTHNEYNAVIQLSFASVFVIKWSVKIILYIKNLSNAGIFLWLWKSLSFLKWQNNPFLWTEQSLQYAKIENIKHCIFKQKSCKYCPFHWNADITSKCCLRWFIRVMVKTMNFCSTMHTLF